MVFFLLSLTPVSSVFAIGTDAGVNIENTATVNFEIAGSPQTPVVSNTTQTRVDELIDAVVVNDNGGPVATGTPDSGVLLQFTVTNNGNGTETFRVVAEDDVAEGGFNPALNQVYLESNGVPGLQIGGDTAYLPGTGDPALAADESVVVYIESNIPGGLSQGDNGDIRLRAVAVTIYEEESTDDPDSAGWPDPGVAYAGRGDGGGDAVVGSSHDTSNLLVRTTGRYQISSAVVAITKNATGVIDPFGGSTVVPGSVITYRLEITVTGSGTAENVVVSDVLPAELDYEANSLLIDGVSEDDDFAPSGTDNSGFNSGSSTLVVDRGSVTGGSPTIVIEFEAAVR